MWVSLVSQIGLVFIFLFLLAGCSPKSQVLNFSSSTHESYLPSIDSQENEKGEENTLSLVIDGRLFQIELVNNPTVTELIKVLPEQFTMKELHGNEKYYDLFESLSVEPTTVRRVFKGDVFLYGTRTLVIFYEDFNTSYSYTRIGRITEPQLLDCLVHEDVLVTRE